MPQHLALFFDGTWNTQKDRTNVSRLSRLVLDATADGRVQQRYYDRGVGTQWHDRLLGGAFGAGLTQNICDGYRWLSRALQHSGSIADDRIYLFGFSRGAYTARSLAGLVRKCGVLRQADEATVRTAHRLYRDRRSDPDSAIALRFRREHSHEVRIHFIGVWDTVGELGVPLSGVPFGRDEYKFHDTALSKIVNHAYQALAIDEHRKDFAPTLWTQIKPSNQEVEQRWFVGAHADVGGGYSDGRLQNLPLRWIQDKAAAAGLAFASPVPVQASDVMDPPHDSYSEFAFGLYKLVKGGKRHHRRIGGSINETLDPSVWRKWQADPAYRPESLRAHADVLTTRPLAAEALALTPPTN
ncbi:DUF2235 domain-containing protein [Hydrocarboniphaga effusa]|jgi:uncharacterized protein (DUF2235 family)|uniref:DUF2235 domain-containing protein n=1 Tax=Hydrocarboniphaga effusa TaxID=243629 RepID=UPI00313813C3